MGERERIEIEDWTIDVYTIVTSLYVFAAKVWDSGIQAKDAVLVVETVEAARPGRCSLYPGIREYFYSADKNDEMLIFVIN